MLGHTFCAASGATTPLECAGRVDVVIRPLHYNGWPFLDIRSQNDDLDEWRELVQDLFAA